MLGKLLAHKNIDSSALPNYIFIEMPFFLMIAPYATPIHRDGMILGEGAP